MAGLLRRLWIQPPAGHPFRALESMCAWWADEFEDKYAAASGPRLDQGLARAGIELFRALPSTAERSVLLATDLHPDNVLAAEREPWLVIDPKPYVGDPTYDPLQHMVHFPTGCARTPLASYGAWPICSASMSNASGNGFCSLRAGVDRPSGAAQRRCPARTVTPDIPARTR